MNEPPVREYRLLYMRFFSEFANFMISVAYVAIGFVPCLAEASFKVRSAVDSSLIDDVNFFMMRSTVVSVEVKVVNDLVLSFNKWLLFG